MDHLLDVVVVNHRTPHDLEAFVQSLKDCRPEFPYRLHIVNTGATDQDRDAGSRAAMGLGGRVVHCSFRDNVGYNEAVNNQAYAYRHEAAPYLALFNADVTLTPGALDHLVDTLHATPGAAVVGPRQVNRDGAITAGGIFGTNTQPKHRLWKGRSGADDLRTDSVTVAGSAMVWRRDIWEELTACMHDTVHKQWVRDGGVDGDDRRGPPAPGAFAPAFHYFGETWACYHARAHDYLCVYDGRVTINHEWHQASPIGGGGWGERHHSYDQALFRELCDLHDPPIERD